MEFSSGPVMSAGSPSNSLPTISGTDGAVSKLGAGVLISTKTTRMAGVGATLAPLGVAPLLRKSSIGPLTELSWGLNLSAKENFIESSPMVATTKETDNETKWNWFWRRNWHE
jgi:hypothetical protein